MENYKHCGSVPRFTYHADWRYPHDGRNPDLSDSVKMAESIALVASVRALDGADPAVIGHRRDSRFTPMGICCLFSKLDTSVQILVLRDV